MSKHPLMKAASSPQMIEDSIEAVLAFFTATDAPIHVADLDERTRNPYVLKVRAVTMYFLKVHCGMSYKAIGARFKRDHTSILNMVRRAHDLCPKDELDDIVAFASAQVQRRTQQRRQEALEAVGA